MAERTYRIRQSRGGRKKSQTIFRLTVPPELARLIPEDQDFLVSLDEKGLHYIPTTKAEPLKPPSWAKRG